MTFERTIFIGDVHGCTSELLTLLGALRVKPHTDRVVFLGDLVDKGNDSLGSLRLARQTVEQLPGSLVIMGNHEKKWLRKFKKGDLLPQMDGVTAEDMAFVATMPLFARFPEIDWFAVHGGVFPKLREKHGPLTAEDAIYPHPSNKKRGEWMEKMAHTRRIDSDGDFVPLDKEAERGVGHWSATYDGAFGWAIFGHQAEKEPILGPHALGIDTGCCYGWALTAAIVRKADEKPEIVQVPAMKQYAVHRDEE